MRLAALCVVSLLCVVAAASGPSNPAQWTLARKQPRMQALTAAIAARRGPSRRPSLVQSREARGRDPKPRIAVHNNGTHLLLKLVKDDQEHCASLVARPSVPDDEEDDDAIEITSHINQVSAVGLDPSDFRSDVGPNFYGVFGVLSTSSGHYLGLISKVERVLPEIFPDLMEIKEVKLLAIPGEGVHVDPGGPDPASVFRAMNSAFQQHSFCFSMSDFDPTRTLQWNARQRARRAEEPAWKLSNHQFFWNQRLLKPMVDAELHEFITPVANMVIHSTVLPLAGRREYQRGKAHDAQLVLVSRRSCNNQGQRYIKRGIDPEGNVANFVETEQIFRYDNNSFSFTQIRGSIPLFWRQLDKYKLHPKIRVESDLTRHLGVLRKHIQELQQAYLDLNHSNDARITFVNLIDKAGDQGKLGTEFRKALAALQRRYGSDDLSVPEIISADKGAGSKNRSRWRASLTRDDLPEQHLTHLWFDFHHNCKDRHLRSLRRLYPAIFANKTVGYFGPVEEQQLGGLFTHEQADVIRTNCVDCLDRTNVVQSVIGRWALQSQMRDLGLLPADKARNDSLVLPNKDVERAFRTLWGKNGDSMSLLYAGSPALKRDITILGRRTRKGMLEDGFNSLLRYYINNFRDESRQRAVDLLLGVDTAAVVPATLLNHAVLAIQANFRTVLAIGLAYLVTQLMYRPGNNRAAG